MKRSSAFVWVLFALIGLAVAAGVSIAASRLSSERIGLSSEPITAGKRLVPPRSPVRHRRQRRKRTPAPVTTVPSPAPAKTVPSPAPTPQVPATPSAPPKKTTTTPRHGDDYHPEREIKHGDD
jgi:hypothetical protein